MRVKVLATGKKEPNQRNRTADSDGNAPMDGESHFVGRANYFPENQPQRARIEQTETTT